MANHVTLVALARRLTALGIMLAVLFFWLAVAIFVKHRFF